MRNLLKQLTEVVNQVHSHHTNHHCSKNTNTVGQSFVPNMNTLAREHVTELQLLSADPDYCSTFNQHLRSYQNTLIHLLDGLHSNTNTCQSNSTLNGCPLNKSSEILLELLCFLRQQFPKAFDENLHVPLRTYEQQKNRIYPHIDMIRKKLRLRRTNPVLISIVLHPLTDFCDNRKKHYSYCDLTYLNALKDTLTELYTKPQKKREFEKLLCIAIIQHNLNSKACQEYFKELFSKICYLQNSREEQLQVLKYFLKEVKQVTANTKFRYNPNMEDIKSILTNWLNEEIGYIENSCHINESIHLQPENNSQSTDKLKLNLAVTHISMLIKALVENNLILTANQSEVFRFFSQHFSSCERTFITPNSLSKKYYSPKKSTIEELKDTILILFNWIQKQKPKTF